MPRASEYYEGVYLLDRKTNKQAYIKCIYKHNDSTTKYMYYIYYPHNKKEIKVKLTKLNNRYAIDHIATVLYGK